MDYKEAMDIIAREELGRYKRYTFDGSVITDNQIGIREAADGWQVFCTSERGGVEIIKTYKDKGEAISHMIKGLRVEKSMAERPWY
ncbi:hypothetical protein [Anaerocolumna xylanovorans]|uniref:Uncharacterized protein n=1 Tax=Anaerocolumna xylanovorans DSM 12503 TaxID=1121345 RepID=A0A1M7Y679_9FIRM|nr:hypothetical protein [Anaerocolumna xylanovorans]SHO48104.1 hypothetical protein SAMN02745217_01678 [Anaerocolumna xylanovorans DSM 12503]